MPEGATRRRVRELMSRTFDRALLFPVAPTLLSQSHARTSHTQQKGELMEKFKMIMEVINACLQAIWNALFKS